VRLEISIRPLLEWDEFSAYMLGYILGDGSIHVTKHQIVVGSADKEHIENIVEVLGPIHIGCRQRLGWKDFYSIAFTNNGWFDQLSKWGIYPGKSRNGSPQLVIPPKPYRAHFIRGLFDSDGCVSYNNYGRQLKVSLLGHESYLSRLNEFPWKRYRCTASLLTKEYRLTHQVLIKQFYDYIYKDATLLLNRKKLRFDMYYQRNQQWTSLRRN